MSEKLPLISDFKEIFLEDKPLLDVRAPVEFLQGSFSKASNHPILDDHEREVIGTYYKNQGGDAATKLGYEMVSGEVKDRKIAAWKKFIEKNPDGAVFCFRGGKRSRISQQWIYENLGIKYPLVEGGYKAMRNYLIDNLQQVPDWCTPLVLGGRTGIGKTELLMELSDYMIDLEGAAKHRGSAFGLSVEPQPTQINFENNLSVEFLKKQEQGQMNILMEHEGRNIGRCCFPKEFYAFLTQGDLIILEEELSDRVDRTYEDYIINDQSKFQDFYGEGLGEEKWREKLRKNLTSIQKRLGGVRYNTLLKIMNDSFDMNMLGHKLWIEVLLSDYYDPMYDYHRKNYQDRIVFTGNRKEIKEFLLGKLEKK